MKANLRHRLATTELAIAAIVLGACASGNGSRPLAESAVPSSAVQAREPESKKESSHAPVTPVPVEFRTPEQAAGYAADPKAPTGALIIKPPVNVLPPDTSDSRK